VRARLKVIRFDMHHHFRSNYLYGIQAITKPRIINSHERHNKAIKPVNIGTITSDRSRVLNAQLVVGCISALNEKKCKNAQGLGGILEGAEWQTYA
jgi:hypothetical protein